MSKSVRKILGSLNTASLIMAGSLPLMAVDAKQAKSADAKTKTAQDAKKSVKPKVGDKTGSKSCGADGKSCSGAGKKTGSAPQKN